MGASEKVAGMSDPEPVSTSDALAQHIRDCAEEVGIAPSSLCGRAIGYPGLMKALERREARLREYRRQVDAFMRLHRGQTGEGAS